MPVSENQQRAAARHTGFVFSEPGLPQRPSLRHLALLLIALSMLSLGTDSAWSFETVPSVSKSGQARNATSSPRLTTSSSQPTMADDQCLPLLKSYHIDYNASAMDRNRRSAGENSGIGLVFGIRFALGSDGIKKPANAHNAPRLDLWQPGVTGDPHALAIADYNRCKSDQALKALSDDWRWSR